MDISNSLVVAFDNLLNINGLSGVTHYLANNTFKEGNLYQRYMSISVPYNGRFFMPVLHARDITKALKDHVNNSEEDVGCTLAFPLYSTGEVNKNTSAAILNYAFRTGANENLITINAKDNVYYCGNGIMLDSNWMPLLLAGELLELSNTKYVILKKQCYISPRVFENNDLVSKALIKKFIPYVTSSSFLYRRINHNLDFWNCVNFEECSLYDSNPVEVIIKNVDSYFRKVPAPMYINAINDEMWNNLNAICP
jgi:hypothetical protein